MPTNTTNYNLLKPIVGADTNDWGGFLNTNFDDLDAFLTLLFSQNYAATRPASVRQGGLWVDSDDNTIKFYNGTTDVPLARVTSAGQELLLALDGTDYIGRSGSLLSLFMNSAAVVRIEDTETTFLDGYSLAFGTGKDSTISHDNTDGLEVVSSVKVTVQTTDDVVISGDTVELLSNNDVEITAPELLLNGSPIIPAGAVMAFAMNSAPAGWLKANGAAVSRTTYARLFAAIGVTFGVGDGITTFNLPDLRGEFVRGWVDNRTLAPETGRALGSAQNDAFQGHWHNIRTGNSSEAASPNPADRVSRRFSNALLGDTDLAVVTPVTDQVHGTPRISSETRPRNVALLYCIKT